jgi:hypothetical protein
MDVDSHTRTHPSPDATRGARDSLRDALAGLRTRVTMERDGLVLMALEPVDRAGDAPAYLTFAEAAASGAVEIREIGAGTVPTVEAVAKDRPVLVFGGDTIIGGKQNRFINVTIWLAAMTVTQIPVTCLELGRWDHGHAIRFGAGRKADYALRSMVSAQVSEHHRRFEAAPHAGAPDTAAYAADQGAVWAEIGQREARAGHRSSTSALHDLYEAERQDAGPLAAAFPCPTGATGLAVGVGGRLVALELFDAPATLASAWQRLVESAVSAHLDYGRAVATGAVKASVHHYPTAGALGRMVSRTVTALDGASVGPSLGEGLDVRLASPQIAGSALVREGRVVHAELFRVAP